MLDEDFLNSLPDEPDEALVVLYKLLKSQLANAHDNSIQMNGESSFNLEQSQRSLLNVILAFTEAHNLDLGIDRKIPWQTDDFTIYFQGAIETIERYIARTSFQRAAQIRNGTSGTYVLSAELKSKIHKYLSSVRELIAASSLSDTKRTALSKKLNAFAEEVDRDKTRIESLAAAMVWTRKELVEGAQGLEPIIEKMDKMFQSFAKATEFLRLPSAKDQKQLPAPPKRIEGPKRDLDDEVPF
jgi:hypothetical protein